MKTKFTLLILISLIFVTVFHGFGQVKEAENTYTISGKAKRGALGNVDYDGSKYVLSYVTKSTETKLKLQHYTFDNDFKFVDMVEEELEIDKVKTKYTWFVYNGELYSVQGNFVEPNLVGTLVLKEKKITYKYDWLLLGYHKTVEVLNKVKPKNDDGRKFFYYNHAEDDVTGDIYVLCGVRGNASDKELGAMKHLMDFSILKFNNKLELVKETPLSFQNPQSVAFARLIGCQTNDCQVGGMVVVFAPQGGPGLNKYADASMTNYTYFRVDKDLNVIDNIKFQSLQSFWKIDEVVHDVTTDDIYLFGPSALGKDKYYNQLLATTKFKAVQLAKISKNKVEYVTETDLEEMAAKLKAPPSQKKTPEYTGKKFELANYKIASNGDFFVMGQNKDDKGYRDVVSFHFDKVGKLKSQYGLDIKENNDLTKANPADMVLIESTDNQSMFWLLREIRGVSAWVSKPLTYPRIGKIGLSDGSISDFTDYGKIDKDVFYLDPKYPYLQTDGGGKIVFFGSDKTGKTIWFCRVKL